MKMSDAAGTGGDTRSEVAARVPFAELCGLLEKLSKTQGNDKKKRILKDFVDKWRNLHSEVHKDDADSTTDSFYPAMRLLLPHLERERMAYGIKENGLARLMIKVLCLGKDSPDAQRLLNYRAVKTARGDAGDFASMAYFVLKPRCPQQGSLTIQQVNEKLDAIASNNAAKKKTAVEESILYLLKHLSALEQKWLVRMIVKELKVGLSQASVLSVYHMDAEDFFNVNNNLEKVCRLLRDPATRMHEIGISVFSPFTPMLGDRASPDKVEKLMEGKPYFIETKFDGERVLLHKKGDEYKYFSRSQDCADALNDAIDGREEGIMVKDPETAYRPNTRKGGWFKIKPEYVGGLMDELDILIIGGFFGEGHRGGMMSHFLCGVAVPSQDGGEPKVFHSFCKVGSGYSKKQLAEFNQRLADHWQVFDKRNPPDCIQLASGFKEKPDAWIQPDKSCILQVKAAEIIPSERFKVGYTLRFPRVEMIREDKPWYDCMTTADIEELRQKSGGKLAGVRFELGEGDGGEGATEAGPSKKKRRIAPRTTQPRLMARFRGADVSDVEQVSQLLAGREVCVMNGPSDFPKAELERKVVELGGTFVQNPGHTTSFVLAEKTVVKVSNLIRTDKYDIVKVDWFRKVVDSGRWIPWTPGDMIHASPATRKQFQMDYDEYGDSYTADITEEQLRHIFGSMGQFHSQW
nr:hypothetical protein BaRGS_023305 [Batillaria attramentaria]